jgi:hypothetical protein
MRLANISENDFRLRELMPGTSTTTASPAPTGGMPTVGTITTGANTQQPGLATGQMDPAQSAQAAKDRQEEKKQVQDQIKATEQQLIDLRKRLAELG